MTAPTTATVGELLTASKYNQIPARLTAVATYVPTFTNWSSATIAATTTGKYWLTGNICHVFIQSKLGTGVITVGNITVTVPVAIDTTGMITDSTMLDSTIGMTDVSGGPLFFGGAVRYIDASTVRVMRYSSGTAGAFLTVNSTAPFTWQTLDELSIMFSYPVA